jgi:hypothetical protein
MVSLLGLLLAVATPSITDGLAPEGPGFAGQGTRLNVVARSLDGTKKLKLLISDGQTDAPLGGQVEVEVYRFGPTGQSSHAAAVAGSYPGHYLVELPQPGSGRQSLVVKVTVAGREPELLAVDGIAGEPDSPPTLGTPAKPMPDLPVFGLAGFALVVLLRRRRALLPGVLALAIFGATDARAHGPGGDVAPEPPGSVLYLSQELQFELGVRTSTVELRTFAAPGATEAPRQYPAVPRSAVVERYGKKLLIVRLGPERFVAREATLGWTEPGFVAVERGVNPGEHVVVEGAAYLRNGGAVAP